jgi:putative transposase
MKPMTMGRRAYPSDVTDEEWEILGPLIPTPNPEGRPALYERREIVNAILYVLRSGCPWRLLPHDLPTWETVYWYFRRWEREGLWKQIWEVLHRSLRVHAGRDPDPSVGALDSQSVKTGPVRGSDKGYDAGKKNLGTQATFFGG